MFDTFIFDLDGTLVTHEMDFASHMLELERILVERGLPKEKLVWKDGFIASFNTFKKELDAIGHDGGQVIDELIESIRCYEVSRAPYTRAIEGATDTLRYLREKGYKIAIVTRNNKKAAKISIDNAQLRKYADIIITRDDVPSMKPKEEQFVVALEKLGSRPENTVVVGDYSHEIIAGNKMGCMTVGVLSGSGDKERLKDAKLIISSVKGIVDHF